MLLKYTQNSDKIKTIGIEGFLFVFLAYETQVFCMDK